MLLGFFWGALAYEQYTIYRVNKMMEPFIESMDASLERSREAANRSAEISRQRTLESQRAAEQRRLDLEAYAPSQEHLWEQLQEHG